MKSISLRDFQLKPSKYLDKLPIVLTRYNKPIAVVHPVDGVVEDDLASLPPREAVEEIAEDIRSTLDVPSLRQGFCERHFERGVNYPLVSVAFEDINGNEASPKWACPECIKKMKSEVKRNGGKVIYK